MPLSVVHAAAWAAFLQGLALLTSEVIVSPTLTGPCSREGAETPWWCEYKDLMESSTRAGSSGSGVGAGLSGRLALYAVHGARLQLAALASGPADWMALAFLVAAANAAVALIGVRTVRAIAVALRRAQPVRAAAGGLAASLVALVPVAVRLLPLAVAAAVLHLIGSEAAAAAATPVVALPLAARQWWWCPLWGLVALLHEVGARGWAEGR
jgi:hypothetical protein